MSKYVGTLFKDKSIKNDLGHPQRPQQTKLKQVQQFCFFF